MRAYPLANVQTGMTRLREKGGASPNALYDLVNGYVTQARTVHSRPGSTQVGSSEIILHGLVAFRGALVTLTDTTPGSLPTGVTAKRVRHPSSPTATIVRVHFLAPFLGYLYAVVEWSDGLVFHYWLQDGNPWARETVYAEGVSANPRTDNGFAYKAKRSTAAADDWTASARVAANDRVRPTAGGNYEMVAVAVGGSTPSTGTTEPAWALTRNGLTIEEADVGTTTTTAPSPGPNLPNMPGEVGDRYGGGFGSGAGNEIP